MTGSDQVAYRCDLRIQTPDQTLEASCYVFCS